MNGVSERNRIPAGLVDAALLGLTGLCIGAALLAQPSGGAAVWNLALASVVVGALPMVRRVAAARAAPRPVRRRRLILVGAGPVAEHVAREAEERGFHVLGCVEDLDPAQRLDWPAAVLAPRSALPELALYLRADQIMFTDTTARVWELVEQIERSEVPAEVFVVPDNYELALCRPSSLRVGDVALVRVPRSTASWRYRTAKRAMDVGLSVLLLVPLAPLMLLAMLAIRLSSPGPVLFRQVRVGRHGQDFEIVKLRTMVSEAERDGPQFCKGKGDPRLTSVGRFLRATHLDEVPQLWNVLRGEMSLVGPRPERPVFVAQFECELPRYAERHRVTPGITGLAQMNGYYHSSPREKLRYDLMYVYHPSLWMDLCILVRTGLSVFS